MSGSMRFCIAPWRAISAKRYANADELLYELEYYIYHKGYGPTNETLGKFIQRVVRPEIPQRRRARPDHGGGASGRAGDAGDLSGAPGRLRGAARI